MTGQVQAQARDVGLLKAIGAKPSQVALLLAGQIAAATAIAAAIGILVARLAMPVFLGDVRQWFRTSDSGSFGAVGIATVFAIVVAVALVAALVPAIRAGRASMAATLASASTTHGGVSSLARLGARLRLPRVVAFGFKDPFTRRTRAWLTIGAIGVASASIVAVSTMESTFDAVMRDPALIGLPPAELVVERLSIEEDEDAGFVPITDEELVAAIDAHPDVEAWMARQDVLVSIGGRNYRSFGIDGDLDRVPLAVVEGRHFEGPKEAIIGLGLARSLDLKVGDERLVRFFNDRGPSRVFTIVGIYIDDENNGEVIAYPMDELRRVLPEITRGEYWVALRDGADNTAVQADLLAAIGGRISITNIEAELASEVAEIRSEVRPLLFSMSGFLLVLVGLNLLMALTLAVRERTREIGIMKTIGFTPRQVVVSIISGALLLAAVGAVLGAPPGWLFMRLLLSSTFNDDGLQAGELIKAPSALWLLGMLVAIAVVAIVGSILPARRTAGLSVGEALRCE